METVDYTVFYYTYSTIAQTLAGLSGLMVAIVLFYLQYTRAQVDQFEKKAATSSYRTGDMVIEGGGIQFTKKAINNMKKRLSISIKLTGFTIVVCFLLMPMTNPYFISNYYIAWLFCGATIVLSLVTLGSYVPVLKEIAARSFAES